MAEDLEDIMPDGVDLRDPKDTLTLRRGIFDSAKKELASAFPLVNNGVRIELKDLDYDDGDDFTPAQQKDAVLTDKFLHRRLRGAMELYDDTTGELLDRKERMTLMRVPWLSSRGTFLHNGSEYTTAAQARLLPGAYTRVQDNGGLETQFNTKLGTGPAMRVGFEPADAQYRLRIGDTSDIHFYSLLSQLGVKDEEMAKAWGPQILERNKSEADLRALDRAYKQMVRPHLQNPSAGAEEKAQAVREGLNKSLIHRGVAAKTLPGMFDPKWRTQVMAKRAAEYVLEKHAGVADDGGLMLSLGLRAAAADGAWREIGDFVNAHYQAGVDLTKSASETLEGLLCFIRGEEPRPQVKRKKSATALKELLRAKEKSDQRAYPAKHAIVAGLMLRHPEDFAVDSRDPGGIWGITHTPTGFRMHVPSAVVPASVGARERQEPVVKLADFEDDREAAREATNSAPSLAQIEAGNFAKGPLKWHSMRIKLETIKGGFRHGVDKSGKAWKVKMPCDYGYFTGTVGHDKDALDVFLGPDGEAPDFVQVVNQYRENGDFDEHKVLAGFADPTMGFATYLSTYPKGWEKRCDKPVRLKLDDFKLWAAHGDMGRPVKAFAVVKLRDRKKSAAAQPDELTDVDMDGDVYTPVGVRGLLSASEKLLMVNQELVPPDQRDSLEFKRIHTPDKLLGERVRLDTTKTRRKIAAIAARRRSLKHVNPALFDDEAQGLLIGNPLSSPLEEINPMQLVEQMHRVTQMGPGGIGSDDAITPAMQSIHGSQFGFLSAIEGPECFDSQTEVYTQRGWVFWPDVKDDDVFACREDGRLTWHQASRVVREHYTGEMILGENESIRMCVTPNHRVLNTRNVAYQVNLASEVYGKQIRIPVTHAPQLGDESLRRFSLPVVPKTNNFQRSFKPFLIQDWAEFLGWWLAEGTFMHTKHPQRGYDVWQVGVCQCAAANPEKYERIRKLMARMKLIGPTAGLKEGAIKKAFVVRSKQMGMYFERWNRGCYDKNIPEECFQWPVRAREKMLEALLLGDGRYNKKRICYTTVCWRLACDVEKLAISLGYPAFIRIEKDSRPHVKTINYIVSISRAKHRALKAESHGHSNGKSYGNYWSKVAYDGMVYCATVPGGLLLVRGKPGTGGFWSGNSSRAGIDTRIVWGAKIGSDGKLYQRFRNPKTGRFHWLAHDFVAGKTLGLPA